MALYASIRIVGWDFILPSYFIYVYISVCIKMLNAWFMSQEVIVLFSEVSSSLNQVICTRLPSHIDLRADDWRLLQVRQNDLKT